MVLSGELKGLTPSAVDRGQVNTNCIRNGEV